MKYLIMNNCMQGRLIHFDPDNLIIEKIDRYHKKVIFKVMDPQTLGILHSLTWDRWLKDV